MTLTRNAANQVATGSIAATDGGRATVTVKNIDIDRVDPTVRVTGVRDGATYRGKAPKARCQAGDESSGLRGCTLDKTTRGTRVTVVARAVEPGRQFRHRPGDLPRDEGEVARR